MDLIDFFRKVVATLRKSDAEFALAGGLVASIYRTSERATNDLDFLILSKGDSRKAAASIIRRSLPDQGRRRCLQAPLINERPQPLQRPGRPESNLSGRP